MINKFSLIDAENGLTIGNSSDLIGLTGSCIEKIDDEDFHKITLVNFRFNEKFVEYCKKNKTYINNLYLTILNNEGTPIGAYYYVLKEPHYYHRSGFGEGLIKLEFVGALLQIATEDSLAIWDMRRSLLSKSNIWTTLSKKLRIGWLEVARLYYNTNHNFQDQQNGKYYIDATNVTDSIDFFCALGEAINGPGGYYGYDLQSLGDCLCGGFGATPPFVIYLINASSKWVECDSFFRQLEDIFANRNVTLVCN
ncbi:barstar family protein [Paenibacillus eucommiae]|uniref:RNAse (Barnase) inhibitor barstar n=1 Tax=Paenibacillus eucommiae TaxID=1355755 RepID=A0ABS4IM74_9BACL|nr:barstar family protein [Paenibacillus eucommiae]MBP1988673.1 RNAse (barnase) inhibitor barstar [Paenibacillus eucommiae]